MRLIPALALLALAGLAACGTREEQGNAANDTPIVADAGNVANATDDVSPDNAGNAAAADTDGAALDHLGPIRIGATVAQLKGEGLVVASRDDPQMEGSTCAYMHFKGLPDAAVMLDGERIVRVDIGASKHETIGGVRVGQSEAEALKRLRAAGAAPQVQPHPYTGPKGHYILVHVEGAPRGLILETDGKQVGSYRFGEWEPVQWIEGCS